MNRNKNGNHKTQNQPQYILYEGSYVSSWYPKLMILFYSIALIFCLAFLTTCSSDLEDAISKEYNIPLKDVEDITLYYSNTYSELGIFPLPHTTWYVKTKSGEKFKIASDYFGGDLTLNKEIIDKYILTDNNIYRARKSRKKWDDAWEDLDKRWKELNSEYN